MSEIVKICKIHGEVEKKLTFFQKYGKYKYYTCRLCAQEGARRRGKSIEKKTKAEKLKKLLDQGEIKKICFRHGKLKKDKIRINSRGEVICRICVNDVSKNISETKRIWKNWISAVRNYNDPNLKKKYYINSINNPISKEKRLKRSRILYNIKKNDPVWLKKQREHAAKSRKKLTENYPDSIVRARLKSIGGGKRNKRTYLKCEPSEEAIILKRLHLILKREIRKKGK